jgi:hypothetical protein
MSTLADRVKETFTTTGTGDLTLGNPVENHQSMYEAQGLNDPIEYFWQDDDNEEWEGGIGQHTTTTNFERITIKSNSSGTTDPLNIGVGTKTIICSRSAVTIAELFDQSVASGASPNFTVANMTLDDTGLTVADTTNLQTFLEKTDAALLRARGTGVSSSYTFTVAEGGTTFTVGAVTGEVNSDQGYFDGTYAGAAGVTVTTLSSPSTYVYLDNSFTLQQQTSTPTEQDWNRKIFLARIAVDTDTNLIVGKEFLCNPIGHYGNTIRTLWRYLVASGVPFKIGMEITGHPSDLGFDIAAGTMMEYGGTGDINAPHDVTFSLVEDVTFTIVYRDSVGANVTELPLVWDNLVTDTIIDLGSTTCAAHRIYRFSNGAVALAPGQANYANMSLAKAGARLEEFVLNARLKNAVFMGWWLIEETATGTSGTVDAEFVEYVIGIQGGSSSGLAGCLLRGNNLSDLTDVDAAVVNLGLNVETIAVLTGTAETLALVHGRGNVHMNNAADNVITIPLNSSVAFPIGTRINAEQIGVGRTRIVGEGNLLINKVADSFLAIDRQFESRSLLKTATDTWHVSANYMFLDADFISNRYFMHFDDLIDSYGKLEITWTPTGSFKIKGKFSTTSTDTQFIYNKWDTSGNNRSVLIRFSSTEVHFHLSPDGSASQIVSVAYTPAGKFSSYTAEFNASSSIVLTVDGVTATQSTAYASVYAADTLTYFGSNLGTSNFFRGVLADPELTDIDVPANSLTFALDSATADYELPAENVFGAEEVTNGDFATDSDWTKGTGWTIAGGLLTATSVVDTTDADQTISITEGAVYELSYTISNRTQGGVNVNIGGTSSGYQSSNGDYVVTVVAGSNGLIETNAVGTTSLSLSNISVKQVTNALVYENIPEANRFQAQLDGFDWVGNELVVNGDFATDSDWVLAANATISGGLLNFGSGTVTAGQEILEIGATYKLKYDVDTFVGATMGVSANSFTSPFYASGAGIAEGIRTASDGTFILVSTTDGNKISSSSVKQILEAP